MLVLPSLNSCYKSPGILTTPMGNMRSCDSKNLAQGTMSILYHHMIQALFHLQVRHNKRHVHSAAWCSHCKSCTISSSYRYFHALGQRSWSTKLCPYGSNCLLCIRATCGFSHQDPSNILRCPMYPGGFRLMQIELPLALLYWGLSSLY